jgi:hypothetical protein
MLSNMCEKVGRGVELPPVVAERAEAALEPAVDVEKDVGVGFAEPAVAERFFLSLAWATSIYTDGDASESFFDWSFSRGRANADSTT